MKVLFVDDERIVSEGMRSVIDWRKNGCAPLLVAETVRQALDMIDLHQPELVITDVNMNEMDGIELATIIRERYPEIVVVVLSGYESFSYARRALEAGVVKYLLKPLYPAELENLIAEMRTEVQVRKASRKEMDIYKPIAIESLWRSLLYRHYNSRDEIESKLLQTEINPDGSYWQVALFECDTKNNNVRLEILHILRGTLCPLFDIEEPDGSWLLVLCREIDAAESALLSQQTHSRFGVNLRLSMGSPVDSLFKLHESERNAKRSRSLQQRAGMSSLTAWPDADCDDIPPALETDKTESQRLANKALLILEREFRNQTLSLSDVAQQLHISQAYLSRLFKKYFGAGAAEYITALRIAEAKKLLKAGAQKQSEIAFNVGYANVYYFSTQFKKATGMTPGEYKREGYPNA